MEIIFWTTISIVIGCSIFLISQAIYAITCAIRYICRKGWTTDKTDSQIVADAIQNKKIHRDI